MPTLLRNVQRQIRFASTLRNPYTILGVPRTATDKEIKKRYYKLAFELHPDRAGKGREAEFIDITKAYDTLSKKRSGYDSGEIHHESDDQPLNNNNRDGRRGDTHWTNTPGFKERPMSAYDARSARYRATGEGENKKIYGSHGIVVAGILFASTCAGGIMFAAFMDRRRRYSKELDNLDASARQFEVKAKNNARKISDITTLRPTI